jgi:hypothetical protein
MQHSSLLRAGSQFREKAQRYHNRILANVLPARSARSRPANFMKMRAPQSMEGMTPIC